MTNWKKQKNVLHLPGSADVYTPYLLDLIASDIFFNAITNLTMKTVSMKLRILAGVT
jgi:hypothetical protein